MKLLEDVLYQNQGVIWERAGRGYRKQELNRKEASEDPSAAVMNQEEDAAGSRRL